MTIIPFNRRPVFEGLDDLPMTSDKNSRDDWYEDNELYIGNRPVAADLFIDAAEDEDATGPDPKRRSLSAIAVGLWADPAPIIGLCFLISRIAVATGGQLPRPLAALLLEHVRLGDPASRLVAEWMAGRGVLDAQEVDQAVLAAIPASDVIKPRDSDLDA